MSQWSGKERRANIITLDVVELVMRKYLDEYKKGLENMCDNNVEKGFYKHNEEKVHLDKEEKKKLYEAHNYITAKKKLSWGFWFPIICVGIASISNFVLSLLSGKLK